MVGGAYFPGRQRAIGLKVGMHIALRDYPPDGTPLNTPLTQPVISFRQKVNVGPFFGLTLSQQLFKTIFDGLISK